jgi:hypothetical protein
VVVSSPESDPAGESPGAPRAVEGKPVGLGVADDDGRRSPGRPVAVRTRARRGGRSCGRTDAPSGGRGCGL